MSQESVVAYNTDVSLCHDNFAWKIWRPWLIMAREINHTCLVWNGYWYWNYIIVKVSRHQPMICSVNGLLISVTCSMLRRKREDCHSDAFMPLIISRCGWMTSLIRKCQNDCPDLHWRCWRQASLSPVTNRAVTLTTFPFLCMSWQLPISPILIKSQHTDISTPVLLSLSMYHKVPEHGHNRPDAANILHGTS